VSHDSTLMTGSDESYLSKMIDYVVSPLFVFYSRYSSAILINGKSATTHSVATCSVRLWIPYTWFSLVNLLKRRMHSVVSSASSEESTNSTTQLQLLRPISKTSLLCWQPDVNRLLLELGVTFKSNQIKFI